MRRAVQGATRRIKDGAPPEETINVSDPTNIVVSGTIGEGGAVHGTSTRQRVRVRQNGDETYEETETTETHFR